MKKTVIILSVLALIVGSSAQTMKKQTEENTNFVNTLSIVNNIKTVEAQNTNDKPLFYIQEIDSLTYFTLKEKTNIPERNLEKITDLEQVKSILKGRVIWGKYNEETGRILEDEQGEFVYKIIFRNGKILSFDYPEGLFIAYFPQEDILFLEGEHTSDVIFNLTTGAETDDVGNPSNIIYSPSKQHRLNMYHNGQISIYFIQEKSGTEYQTTIQLTWGSLFEKYIGFIPEYLFGEFWQNDTILNFIAPRYFYSENKTENFYYQLILK